MCDPIVAVLFCDVADYFASSTLVKIHIEVGHRYAIRVEEPLKDQSVLERVKLRNSHGVGGHGARSRTSPGTHPNAVLLRPVNEVRNYQEIARKAHLRDHTDFVFGLGFHAIGHTAWIPRGKSPLHFFFEETGFGLALGNRKTRHVVGSLVKRHRGSLRDEKSVVARFREISKQLPHLCRRLHIELVGIELEPLRIIQS